jgi:hypothetical protein
MTILESNALGCPRRAVEPHLLKFHKPLRTLEIREPYRIHRVQSPGEKAPSGRRMSGICRLEVRSLDEKSLLLLGETAIKRARRINSFRQAGGGRGSGIEPSPRSASYWEVPNHTTPGSYPTGPLAGLLTLSFPVCPSARYRSSRRHWPTCQRAALPSAANPEFAEPADAWSPSPHP